MEDVEKFSVEKCNRLEIARQLGITRTHEN
jgi:hypothetical protein